MSIIARSSAVLLAFAIATPGIARDIASITTQVRVKRVADGDKMERRLQAAAMEACGASAFSFAEYRAAVAKSDCYKTALANAHDRLASADSVTAGMSSGSR
ncbi:hypothetical protein [Sphingomonas sp. MMS24-J13]|uniref:hypothetical protein n=1 Tax=Sphingomonas sp. MMS24-J13 TaxID=3238686 RepID=UPI0038517802